MNLYPFCFFVGFGKFPYYKGFGHLRRGNKYIQSCFRNFLFLEVTLHRLYDQGRCIRRTNIFIFSFCIGLVTQLNLSALGVLKHHYVTKRIRELLIGNSRFLIYNSLNQLLYYTI